MYRQQYISINFFNVLKNTRTYTIEVFKFLIHNSIIDLVSAEVIDIECCAAGVYCDSEKCP